MLYDFLRWRLARPLVRHVLRPTMIGLENIPATGPVLLAGNHISEADSWPVPTVIRRHVTELAKLDFFKATDFKGRLLARVLRFLPTVPVDTRGGPDAHHSLDAVIDILRAGGMVGIFPEGTRSPDGRLYRFHTGVARLALASGALVVPMGCVNTRLRRGFLGLPTLKHAHYTVGEAMDFSADFGRQDDPAVLRRVTDEIAAAIQALTGQTYVDVYARRVKSGELTLEQADAFVRARPGADA